MRPGPLLLVLAACGDNLAPLADAGVEPPRLELVGHSDLGGRGMNAALAVAGETVYVGSRIDGDGRDAGVLIVDVSDPSAPDVVGAIGPPEEGLPGMSSRELRAVADLDLLVVLNIRCSPDLHGCADEAAEPENFRFYDISDRRAPRLIGRYEVPFSFLHPVSPHEFFLWRDRSDPARVLLFVTTPPGPPGLRVLDISDPAEAVSLAVFDAFDDGGLPEPPSDLTILHSLGVSADGRVGYASHQIGGLFLLDLSDLTAGAPEPQVAMLTPPEARVDWSPPEPSGPHSAVEVPGRDLLVVTDEVYPPPYGGGCPWGWLRVVDIANPAAPSVSGELLLEENRMACAPDRGPARVSYTAHNATATAHLALVTWHSAGLQAVDLDDPAAPARLAEFRPEPLASVAVEDPALGGDPVLAWSTPVVSRGLIYFVDIRNGLYILRYTGPHQSELAGVQHLEGNSNL